MNHLLEADHNLCLHSLDSAASGLTHAIPEALDVYLRACYEAARRAEQAGKDYRAWVIVLRGLDTLVASDGRTVAV